MILFTTEERQEFMRLFEARVAFRRRWIASQAPLRKQVKPHHIEWELEYDRENNFARMGAEHVDAAWGLVLKAHPTKIKARRPKSTRAALIAASALNSHHRTGATA